MALFYVLLAAFFLVPFLGGGGLLLGRSALLFLHLLLGSFRALLGLVVDLNLRTFFFEIIIFLKENKKSNKICSSF